MKHGKFQHLPTISSEVKLTPVVFQYVVEFQYAVETQYTVHYELQDSGEIASIL